MSSPRIFNNKKIMTDLKNPSSCKREDKKSQENTVRRDSKNGSFVGHFEKAKVPPTSLSNRKK
jgi:hypothetical protein